MPATERIRVSRMREIRTSGLTRAGAVRTLAPPLLYPLLLLLTTTPLCVSLRSCDRTVPDQCGLHQNVNEFGKDRRQLLNCSQERQLAQESRWGFPSKRVDVWVFSLFNPLTCKLPICFVSTSAHSLQLSIKPYGFRSFKLTPFLYSCRLNRRSWPPGSRRSPLLSPMKNSKSESRKYSRATTNL
jgi:hypothetical protein